MEIHFEHRDGRWNYENGSYTRIDVYAGIKVDEAQRLDAIAKAHIDPEWKLFGDVVRVEKKEIPNTEKTICFLCDDGVLLKEDKEQQIRENEAQIEKINLEIADLQDRQQTIDANDVSEKKAKSLFRRILDVVMGFDTENVYPCDNSPTCSPEIVSLKEQREKHIKRLKFLQTYYTQESVHSDVEVITYLDCYFYEKD